jgi:hypothetical protein
MSNGASLEGPARSSQELAHAASLIQRAELQARLARTVTRKYRLDGATERIEWALDFLADAATEAEAGR